MGDTYETINCPACGHKMKKIFLKDAGVNIDVCTDGCGGIFLDNREFKLVDEQHEELDEIIQAMENNEFAAKVDENAVRICPACGAKMVKNATSDKGNIIVDDCYTCGGKFLDHGELTRIRAEYATEQERADAAVRAFLYSPEGAELNMINKVGDRVQRKMDGRNNSALFKLFTKMFGV